MRCISRATATRTACRIFLQVLDAKRKLVRSRQQLIQADVTLTDDVIALYNALGGG
jgi:outer membrane protein TolC